MCWKTFPPEKAKKDLGKKKFYGSIPFFPQCEDQYRKGILKLIEKAFPVGNPLRKIFNRSTFKIGYKSMPDMAKAISRHNNRILKPVDEGSSKSKWKCQNEGIVCPVGRKCTNSWVVNFAKVTETS